jgi:hypothetical protein
MPNPTQSDLHINAPLTNISVAYMQDEDTYIADKVFPKVPVQKQSDLYWKYHKSEWRRQDVERRAPSTETPGVGWNVTTDAYFCHVYGIHKDIDDQLRANADSNFNMDKEATKFITNQLLLKRDQDWINTYFQAGVWDVDRAGVAASPTGTQFLRWDDAGSDPIGDITKAVIDQRELTGYTPNTLVIAPRVLLALRHHPDILDRIKYTQRGIVTEDLLASLFGVKKLLTTWATQVVGNPPRRGDVNLADDEAEYKFLVGENALLVYSNPSPSLMTPSAGYTFTWQSYLSGNDRGIKVKRFRQENIASDRIEAEMTYDMKVIATDVGTFWSDVVTA